MGGRCIVKETFPRAYNCWINMRQRCRNPRHPNYADYGGRGIDICPEWETLEGFIASIGVPPDGLTLERLDNNKGYSKENCAWVTMAVQNENKRPQKPRCDNKTGIKGVSMRPDGYCIARTDQKHGTKLLYTGRVLEDAIAARKAWEQSIA